MAARKLRPVTGRKKATASVESHWDGWNAALDSALKNSNWPKGSYKGAEVQFFASIDVTNPGNIVEYSVKISPKG